MRRGESNTVAGKIDNDSAVPFGCESLIAIKPGARRGRVATHVMVDGRANPFDCRNALQEPGVAGRIVSTHYDRGA